MMNLTKETVENALREIVDPQTQTDIVSAKVVSSVQVQQGD
ncbi:MAG: DUF59 domain-containing protein, partial [Alphaproteobacteria bacterium]|nr:DUF59 domain-containing protein [Alphaproteobacteria bacterium]